MTNLTRRRLLEGTAVAVATVGLAPIHRALAQSAPAGGADTEWRHYAADQANTRYAPLDQINGVNFASTPIAAEIALQKSTSNPWIRPFASVVEKPAFSMCTPHRTAPRDFTSSSVPATAFHPMVASSSATAPSRARIGFIGGPSLPVRIRPAGVMC